MSLQTIAWYRGGLIPLSRYDRVCVRLKIFRGFHIIMDVVFVVRMRYARPYMDHVGDHHSLSVRPSLERFVGWACRLSLADMRASFKPSIVLGFHGRPICL